MREERLTRLEKRPAANTSTLATGTLACPRCDAPVAPAQRVMTPADALGCPFCGHAGKLRDFLSLAVPARPARVVVRVRPPRRPAPQRGPGGGRATAAPR